MKNEYNIPSKEAAGYLGISIDTLRKYNHQKKISYVIVGRNAFYSQTDLDEFIKKNTRFIKRRA